jgi:transposase-like protein
MGAIKHPDMCPNCYSKNDMYFERFVPGKPKGEFVCHSCGWSMSAQTGQVTENGERYDYVDHIDDQAKEIAQLKREVVKYADLFANGYVTYEFANLQREAFALLEKYKGEK